MYKTRKIPNLKPDRLLVILRYDAVSVTQIMIYSESPGNLLQPEKKNRGVQTLQW